MSARQITKVTMKDGDVTIAAEEEKKGDIIKSSVESDQPPNPELTGAMKELGKYMCDMMQMPKEWKDKHECRSVAVNYEEDDRIGAVVTMFVRLEKFNGGVSINTPHLREKLPGTAGGGAFMPPKMCDLVKEVRDEGEKYMNGDRAQREMDVAPADGEDKPKRTRKKKGDDAANDE